MGESLAPKGAWCVLSFAELERMMREVKAGADPELLMVEFYANSTSEQVD